MAMSRELATWQFDCGPFGQAAYLQRTFFLIKIIKTNTQSLRHVLGVL